MRLFSEKSTSNDELTDRKSRKAQNTFLPVAFRLALNNLKTEKSLASYLQKQAQLHPEEYQKAVQAYVQEKLIHRTGLMRHVSFFDPQNTSSLSFLNGVNGFMDLGFSAFSSFGMTCLVMGGGILGTQTLRPPVEEVHQLQHPQFHTAAFNRPGKNLDAHDRMVERLVDGIMMGREEIEKEDILAFAEEIEKRHPVSGPSKIGQYILKQLQILAFVNLKTVCGGTLTKKNLMDLYRGTLFYAVADPTKVAARLMALRSESPGAEPNTVEEVSDDSEKVLTLKP